ncbi:MAG: hypothetical protein GX369_05890 [Euryarchaeota archaeon]|nr:hypothetical protein [Euryarchaeota archaeon]
MIIKSKRGRRRYIAFATEPSTSETLRDSINSAFKEADITSFKLIQYDGTKGIIRVKREEQRIAVEALKNLEEQLQIRTLAASGTLRTLRDRFFAK